MSCAISVHAGRIPEILSSDREFPYDEVSAAKIIIHEFRSRGAGFYDETRTHVALRVFCVRINGRLR
jgi:hypothetical protein